MAQSHSRLAYRIQAMADSIKSSSFRLTDEDLIRIDSLVAIAADHRRKAVFQDLFYR